jgi:AcrR family transcriptional regulator
MTEEMGRRERKKLATRHALIDAAVELFTEQGFEKTTVAQIAERADVSTRTFFLHFATKEDVLAGEGDARVELGLKVIAERVPGEGPDEAFARAMRAMIDDGEPEETELGRLRYRMALEAPTVRANLLRRRHEAERLFAAALLEQFPDELDEIGADATVAAVMAATYAAAITSLTRGRPMEAIQDAMHRAVDIGMWGRRRKDR